ncbi:MAG: barstar family protein [Clostridia bacterium]|nr:barstar family protein [Clostridia bacterium]
MEEKKVIILDLTGCKYLRELHERIRVAFDFPEWYGANWDAFWDLLWSECDADEVLIIGEYTMSEEFNMQLENMHKMLDELVKERAEDSSIYDDIKPFSYRIES